MDPNVGVLLLCLAVALVVLWIFLLPCTIARQRNIPYRGWLLLVLLLSSWTWFGWFFCLGWALLAQPKKEIG